MRMRRKMKWFLSMLLICVMIMGAAKASSGNFLGEWYGVAVQSDGVQFSMEQAQLEASLFLGEDRTVRWTTNGTVMDGEWQFFQDEDRMELSVMGMTFNVLQYSGERLAMDIGGQNIILSKNKEDPFSSFQLTEASGPEAFSGNWVAAYLEVGGFHFILGDMELPVAGLVIDGETASFVYAFVGTAMEQYDAEYRFEDGKLKLIPSERTDMRIEEILLAENGMLFASAKFEGDTDSLILNCYFTWDSASSSLQERTSDQV